MSQQKVNAYSVYDISRWQTELQEEAENKEGNEGRITLPTLQRGFVWKPYQMEALWDSILRGYPIGALLMSKVDNNKDLLDGQQRCTTIALGFHDPFKNPRGVLNIKPKNAPSIWLDLKPMEKNKYGLKHAVRVLTRSHPWGYLLTDHRKPLSSNERNKALVNFRNRLGKPELSFSQIAIRDRTPWDATCPLPLAVLLNSDDSTFERWKEEVTNYANENLTELVTQQGQVNYSDGIEDSWFHIAFNSIQRAKELLLPEIPVNKEIMEEEDERTEAETDATLFLRINSEGSRISGQELIYSLLKAVFPESKQLVEEISLSYIDPSKVVNIFARLVLIKRNDYKSFHNEVSLSEFRRNLKIEEFKSQIVDIIDSKDAKKLMEKAVDIISGHKQPLPKILYKDIISGNPDLLLVLLVFLSINEKVNDKDRAAIRSAFLRVFLFNKNKERKNVATEIFKLLLNSQFSDWSNSCEKLEKEKPELFFPLLKPAEFNYVLIEKVMKEFLNNREIHFNDSALIGKLIVEDEKLFDILSIGNFDAEGATIEENNARRIPIASSYWINFLNQIAWNRNFLIITQRNYFIKEFKDYMEFDGIEDTNRPWDWDHIYPISWVYNQHKISNIVKWLVGTIGNFRALSFNENRTESNKLSPQKRFEKDVSARQNSLIKENDLEHWLELTNNDNRLIELRSSKVDSFVKAVFFRLSNIYTDFYKVVTENQSN